MTRYGLVCLLLGSMSWGQAKGLISAPAAQQATARSTATEEAASGDLGEGSGVSDVALDKPLITIAGLCENPEVDRVATVRCKTVITRVQFEKLIDALQPSMPAHARREFALRYADDLVMTKKAEEMGLDKGTNYEEQMKLARIEILSRELKRVIQEKISNVSEEDIELYYQSNKARFERAEMDRIYVPTARQALSVPDKPLSAAKRFRESEPTMKEVANDLHARAIAGEEFAKLQADAYQVAGITSAAPNTAIGVRRTSLPPSQTSVMDLKPGEISSVLADPNGLVIYKVKAKSTLPLDQVREEIKATLRLQHMQDELHRIEDAAIPILDESYFARKRTSPGVRPTDQASPGFDLQSNKPE